MMRPRRFRRRPMRGFTLIELSLVCVILGLFLVLVVGSLDGLVPSAQIKKAGSDIGNMIEMGRSMAAAKRVNFAVVYDLDADEFWMLVPKPDRDGNYQTANSGDDGDNEIRQKSFVTQLPQNVKFKDVQLGENFKKENGKVKIEISPLGTASGHIVNLHNEKTGQQYAVELNALTALVSFHQKYTDFSEVEDFDE